MEHIIYVSDSHLAGSAYLVGAILGCNFSQGEEYMENSKKHSSSRRLGDRIDK